MKVRLNIATAPLENNRRFLLGSVLLGMLGVAALVGLSASVARGWSANRAVRTEVSELQSTLRKHRDMRRELEEFFKRAESKRIMDRAAFLNGLIEQRSFPWTKMFTDLERLLPAGVRVVSISPRMAGGQVEVKLSVGALDDEAKLKFLETLEKSPEFARIQLVSETRPTRPEESDRILLDLIAIYSVTQSSELAPEAKREKAAK